MCSSDLEKKRPYIILKWAETADGFLSRFPVPKNREENIITQFEAQQLSHQWRSEEDCIMVGTNTVRSDDPLLTTRFADGKNPVKIIIDRNLHLTNARLFQSEGTTLVITEKKLEYDFSSKPISKIEYIQLDFNDDLIANLMKELQERKYLSILVEGGTILHNHFLKLGLYDEIRVFTSSKKFGIGIKSPNLSFIPIANKMIGKDNLKIYRF